MENQSSSLNKNRRQFTSTEQSKNKARQVSGKHKFQNEFCRTYEDAFKWRFDYYINIMKRFSDYLGRHELLDLIKRAVDDNNSQLATDNPAHTLASFVEYGKEAYKNMMTYEVIEESEEIYEIKVTECLWAKTFRDQNAAEIGYATICHGDFTEAKAYHPKLNLKRTKTLMQRHDCCNHRWTWKG